MKKLLTICILSWTFHMTYAQNSISGKITDENNQPLVGATIFVPDLHKGTVSGADGRYELTDIPNGRFGLQFTIVGYGSRTEKVELRNTSTTIDVQLLPSTIKMDEIVVSGGYHASEHENAVKIDVLTLSPQMISTPNFAEALTQVPGVDMISKGSGVSKPVIRGLAMDNILVLNNGVRFENYQYSSHHPMGIVEFGIEDIEIIKGPASLLYGSDAIGGVINFLKEKPVPMGTIAGDYNLQLHSNTMGVTNNLGVKASSKKLHGGIRVGQSSHADFLQGGGEFVPNTRFNEMSVQANAGTSSGFGTFHVYYDYTNQNLGLAEDHAVEEITERGRKNGIFYQEFNTHLLSSQNKLYLGRHKLDVNAAFQNTELTHFGDEDEVEVQMALATATYDVRLHLPSDSYSEYILGLQGFHQLNTNLNERETKLLPDATTNNYSVYGLVQRTFWKKLRLQTGLRYDNKHIDSKAIGTVDDPASYRAPLSKSFGSVSGSIGAVYNASGRLYYRANFAAAYRTPNLAELTSNGQHELRYEIGDAGLAPQNAYETDLSMHYHVDNITFDIAGFYNVIDNYIYIAPTGDTTSEGISIYKYRQSNATLFGGEAGLHIHPGLVPWLHFETVFASVIGKQKNGDYLPFIPAHNARFELRGEKEQLLFLQKAYLSFNVKTAFDQNNAAPEETTSPGYTLVDMSVGGKIKMKSQSLSISLHAANLFDTKYTDHLSTLKEVGMHNPGRNISLRIQVPFGGNLK